MHQRVRDARKHGSLRNYETSVLLLSTHDTTLTKKNKSARSGGWWCMFSAFSSPMDSIKQNKKHLTAVSKKDKNKTAVRWRIFVKTPLSTPLCVRYSDSSATASTATVYPYHKISQHLQPARPRKKGCSSDGIFADKTRVLDPLVGFHVSPRESLLCRPFIFESNPWIPLGACCNRGVPFFGNFVL